jgi:tRNA pseudouridine synthase 10
MTRLRPVFIGGRYTKASRQLAQTIHYCLYCKGRGCLRCKGKGRTEYLSVQEKIAPFFEAACTGNGNFFHGAGREDVDVRMLGRGRPFVIEIVEPHIRFFDLFALAASINDANRNECAVHDLYFTNRIEVARIKEARHEKIYRAMVRTDAPLEPQSIAHLAGQSFEVAQRTPNRVEHRRADMVRNRRATVLKAIVLDSNRFETEIRTDAGLYVKEFIFGDHGRSDPSLSSILGMNCTCLELDVLEIVEPAQSRETG